MEHPMSKVDLKQPRVRVEPNVYYRINAEGRKIYEIGWRDSTGKWCRRIIGPKISEARHVLRQELAKRGRNEPAPLNPKLTFGEALSDYLDKRIGHLRESTQAGHRWAAKTWLRPRFGNKRLDRIDAADWASFIEHMREQGKSDGTINTVLKTARAVYSNAARFHNWSGTNALSLLTSSERPKVGTATKRRLFTTEELDATLAAAVGQNGTLFAFLASTGCRISEALGLCWEDLDLANLDAATVEFRFQVDGKGERQPLKTEAAERQLDLGRSIASILAAHKVGSQWSGQTDFVFATGSGKPLSRHNVHRELRATMRAAVLSNGKLAFPILSETDDQGEPVPVPKGAVPSLHSFRHTYASDAIHRGDGTEEVSWDLGHRDSTVTRRVYIAEVRTAERSARRRQRNEDRDADRLAKLGSALGSGKTNRKRHGRTHAAGQVVELSARRP
jgi:integrase